MAASIRVDRIAHRHDDTRGGLQRGRDASLAGTARRATTSSSSNAP